MLMKIHIKLLPGTVLEPRNKPRILFFFDLIFSLESTPAIPCVDGPGITVWIVLTFVLTLFRGAVLHLRNRLSIEPD